MRKLLRREQFQALFEAMYVYDGGNEMTEVLQLSLKSNQTADIFNLAQTAQKKKSRSATATPIWICSYRYRCKARYIYTYIDMHIHPAGGKTALAVVQFLQFYVAGVVSP